MEQNPSAGIYPSTVDFSSEQCFPLVWLHHVIEIVHH